MKAVKVKIMGEPYTVRIEDIPSGDKDIVEFGNYDPLTKTITINGMYDRERMIKTFIHEVLEVLNDELELQLSHPKITQIEAGIYGSIKAIGKFISVVNAMG
jgi:hypothetical protein